MAKGYRAFKRGEAPLLKTSSPSLNKGGVHPEGFSLKGSKRILRKIEDFSGCFKGWLL